ncbi:MAG: DUF4430 domain-containing protein [Patescibacteria group bacterium]|nr:DUF4430 domain-containing protein [Patescibacteria group bacterium]
MTKKAGLIGAIIAAVIILLGGVFYYNFVLGPKTTDDIAKQTEKENQNINASMEINGNIETMNVKEGTTAFQLMQALKEEAKLSYSGKDYPDMGFFVEEINGEKNDSTKNMYWLYYVNDQPATEGISQYVLKDGDKITWKYEASKF